MCPTHMKKLTIEIALLRALVAKAAARGPPPFGPRSSAMPYATTKQATRPGRHIQCVRKSWLKLKSYANERTEQQQPHRGQGSVPSAA